MLILAMSVVQCDVYRIRACDPLHQIDRPITLSSSIPSTPLERIRHYPSSVHGDLLFILHLYCFCQNLGVHS